MRSRTVVITGGFVLAAMACALLWDSDEHGAIEAPRSADNGRDMQSGDGASPATDGTRRESIEANPTVPVTRSTVPAFFGRVEDFDGAPLAHVIVSIVGSSDERASSESSTTTQADGSFALPTEGHALSRLQFVAADCVDAIRDGVIAGIPIVVQLERGFVIRGRAVHAGTDVPFERAEVSRGEPDWPRAFTTTDAEGRFSIVVRRLPAAIEARGVDHCVGVGIAYAPNETIEIEVPDAKPDAIAWYRVIDRDTKEPIEDATIRPAPSEVVGTGLYRAGIAIGVNGKRYATVRAPGRLKQSVQPTATQGRSSSDPIEVALPRAGSVIGRIVDVDGRAIAAAEIVVGRDPHASETEGGAWFPECETVSDTSGNFRVADVPPQVPWVVCASTKQAMLFCPVPVLLTGHDPLDLGDLRADPNRDLEVRVTSVADGSRCPKAIVWSFDGINTRVASTDADGVAVVHGALRTRFVCATAPGLAPAGAIVNGEGGDAMIELRLARGAKLSGAVRDAAGVPLRDARVTARALSSDPMMSMIDSIAPTAVVRTDASGRFTFADLAPGKYRIGGHHVDATRGAIGASGQETVDAETGRFDLLLTLTTTGTLVLRVTSATTGAAVGRVFTRTTIGGNSHGSFEPNTNGRRMITIAARRPFDLEVSAVGFASQSLSRLMLEPHELRVIDVPLNPVPVRDD